MKQFYKKMLALVLALLCVLSLFGCVPREGEVNKQGVSIVSDGQYSVEALARCEEELLALMRYAYVAVSPLDMPTEKMEARLADYSARVRDITVKTPISEKAYLAMVTLIAEQGESVVDEWIAFRKGEVNECVKMRQLYLSLSYICGAKHVASMLYDICLLIYDIRYERTMEKYETYGYPWYAQEAMVLSEEKTIFAEHIGREDFSALMRCSTAFCELFSKEFQTQTGVFTDADVLVAIRSLDVEEIDVDEEGFALLLSYLVPKEQPSADAPYRAKLRYAFGESGDTERVADVMDDVFSLLFSVLQNLTTEDVAMLRVGECEGLICAVFEKFTEEEWVLFSNATSVSLSCGAYCRQAEEMYADAYLAYVASLSSVTLAELRACVGDETFCEKLTAYLAGICPAILYEVTG